MLLSALFPWSQRHLILQFSKREILARYRGSILGLAWVVINPLLMLAVYTFVFQYVFKSKWPTSTVNQGGLDFSIQVYSGLILFNCFAEIISRAPRLILEQPNLVKKVVFPLEILPWVSVLAGLFHLTLNSFILLGALWINQGHLPSTLLALPVLWLPFIFLLLAIAWLLAALGTYLRDLAQITVMAINMLMFLSPIFYATSALPPRWQPWLQLNPLTFFIETQRNMLVQNIWPNPKTLFLYLLGTLIAAGVNAYIFLQLKKGFADVL